MSIATATPTLPNLGDKLYWSPLDIARLLGVSRRTVWAMIARRQSPRPVENLAQCGAPARPRHRRVPPTDPTPRLTRKSPGARFIHPGRVMQKKPAAGATPEPPAKLFNRGNHDTSDPKRKPEPLADDVTRPG